MLKIGLTGGIGSGKTTVANCFEKLGVTIIDADKIAHLLTTKGSPLTEIIVNKFGTEILKENSLDRTALRKIVFDDPEKKLWLEQLLHPQIRKIMQEQAEKASSPYCILVIPLLIENNLMKTVDRVLVVDVSEATQLQRASERDQQHVEQIRAIIKAQCNRQQRLAVADDIINNENTFENVEQQVQKLHQFYLSLVK